MYGFVDVCVGLGVFVLCIKCVRAGVICVLNTKPCMLCVCVCVCVCVCGTGGPLERVPGARA
jgi:hypothetical protein